MPVRINSVNITPSEVTVGQTVTITVSAEDIIWNNLKVEFTNWLEVENNFSNWKDVRDYKRSSSETYSNALDSFVLNKSKLG